MLYPTTETGSIVKLRNGKLAIKINNTFIGQKDKNGNYNTYAIDYPYIDEIEYTTRDFDIVEIYKAKKGMDLVPFRWFENLGNPIWESQTNFKKGDKVLVSNDRINWTKAYYVRYEDGKNLVKIQDKHTEQTSGHLQSYSYCEKDIEEFEPFEKVQVSNNKEKWLNAYYYKTEISERHFKTYDVIMTSLRDFVQDPKTRNFNYCRKYKEDGDN